MSAGGVSKSRRSRVINLAFVTRAVATIIRSAGSRWNVSGRQHAATAICGRSGSTEIPGAETASSIHCDRGRPSAIRPREASSAASQTEIAAILSWPEVAARLIALRALIANSSLASINQIHTCVSSSNKCRSDVWGIRLPFHVDRLDEVTANLRGACHMPEEIYRVLLDRHQLCHRLAPLGNDDGLRCRATSSIKRGNWP